MITIRQSSQTIDRLVRAFFDYVRDKSVTAKYMSELFRYSICKALGLDTVSNDAVVSDGEGLIPILKQVCEEEGITGKPLEYRQGIVEGCVHSIEMSRKYAGL